MSNSAHIWAEWLLEQDMPALGGQMDMPVGGPPVGAAGMQGGMGINPPPGMPSGQDPNQNDPNITNQPKGMAGDEPDMPDVTADPQAPDMPEQGEEEDDFEVWRSKYFKESIKGDSNELIDLLNEQRDKDDLEPIQRKFVEDNFNIQLLRQNSNIEKASKEIRKLLKDQLDQNNPSTSVVNHIFNTLSAVPQLNNIFLKLTGYGESKGGLHRKYIAALIGGVQVGTGANTEDVIYNEREYSIMLSTRFQSEWGAVNLGNWALREDDPQRFLSEPEQRRLHEGSPDEKEALRHRLIIESIAEQFKTRAFLVNIVGDDGMIFTLGWDIANSLRAAFTDGKIQVTTRTSDNGESFITSEGDIVPFVDCDIYYIKETGEQDEEGNPDIEQLEFLERRNGILFLKAQLPTIKHASANLAGIIFKEQPYNGNPSDLKVLRRCNYSVHDLIMRQC
jgi:hypothetical protein